MQVVSPRRTIRPVAILIALCVLALGSPLPASGSPPSAVAQAPMGAASAPRSWQKLDNGYDNPAADDLRGERAAQRGHTIGNNVAILYVDVSGLGDGVPRGLPRGVRVRFVDVATMDPRKVKALGLTGMKRVAVLTDVSDRQSAMHSERKLIAHAGALLRSLGVPKGQLLGQLRSRARALVSERSSCPTCRGDIARHIPDVRQLALVGYVPGKNAPTLEQLWNSSVSARHDEKEAAESRARDRGVMDPAPTAPSEPAPGQPEPGPGPSLDGAAAQNPGGIDFKSMSLRYLSVGEDAGDGAEYAFKSDPSTGLSVSTPEDGAWAAKQASDAFFVWLALPTDTFWVNLNPDEPDRIMDETFGKTDAGRVLLEADLRLKKSTAVFLHPHSRSGRQYWNQFKGRCSTSRVWITPDEAKVREDGDQLYILDAPLRVQMEQMYVGKSNCRQPDHINKHNEALYRRLILPRLVYAVNHAPEYAALRRVYTSRVAAEWYRQRDSHDDGTGYADVVDSGDISTWQIHGGWTPRSTYKRYLHSQKHGEWKVNLRSRRGNYIRVTTITYGGVNFADLVTDALSDDEFRQKFAAVGKQVDRLFDSEDGIAAPGRETWVGGTTPADEPAEPEDEEAEPEDETEDSDEQGTEGEWPDGLPTELPDDFPTELPDEIPTELLERLPDLPTLDEPTGSSPDEEETTEASEIVEASEPPDRESASAPPNTEAAEPEPGLARQVGPPVGVLLLVLSGIALLLAGLVRRGQARGVR